MGCMMLQRGTAAACNFTKFVVVVLLRDQPRNVTAVGDQKVEPVCFGWWPRQERRGMMVLTLDASPLSPHFGF